MLPSMAKATATKTTTKAKSATRAKVVYLVHGHTGVGGDTQVWCVGAFMSRDDAGALAKRANDWLEERSALGGFAGVKVRVGYERCVEIMKARPKWLLGLAVDYNGAYFDVSEPVVLHKAGGK